MATAPSAHTNYHRHLAVGSRTGGNRPPASHFRYLFRSLLFLLVLAALGWLSYPTLRNGFDANPALNGTILLLLLFGILYTLRGLLATINETRTVRRIGLQVDKVRDGLQSREEGSAAILDASPRGIGPFLNKLYRVLRRGDASATLPYLLDSVANRADDRRALGRYLSGALVLLGLIGTFYGLLETLGGVRGVLAGLSASGDEDTLAILATLQERLAQPLGGMGMAFSSSLFGLLASLVLSFLELQLFHAQNDLHADLEALVVSDLIPLWRRVGGATGAQPGETPLPSYIGALLEQSAERLEQVTEQLERLTRQESAQDRLAQQNSLLTAQIEALRNTLEQLEQDRTTTLRDELRLLTRTLARQQDHHAPQE